MATPKKKKKSKVTTLPEVVANGTDYSKARTLPEVVANGKDTRVVGTKSDFERIARGQAAAVYNPNEDSRVVGTKPDSERMAREQAAAIKESGVDNLPQDDKLSTLKKDLAAAKEASLSDYDYLQQLTDKYAPTPLTSADIEKRKRAANIIASIGSLGNALNAISNLITTHKGAPSQTLPKNVDTSSEIAKLEASEKSKRNEIYQRAKDRIAQKRAEQALQYQRGKDAQAMEAKKKELEIKMKGLELQVQKAEREGKMAEARLAREKWNAVKAEHDAKYAPQRHKAYINSQNASANSASKRAIAAQDKADIEREKNEETIHYTTSEGNSSFKIRKNDWNNESILAQMAVSLGLPIKKMRDMNGGEIFQIENSDRTSRTLNKEELQILIGEAMADPKNEDKAVDIRNRYGIQSRKPNPMKEKKKNPMS